MRGRWALLLLIVTACRSPGAPSRASNKGAILSESEAEALCLCPMSAALGYWTPSSAQVVALEAKLEDYVRTNAPVRPRPPSLSGMLRQYAGIIVGGRRLICVNAFRRYRGLDENWRRQAVMVADGGCGFWHLEYDPATGQFEHLRCNGVA